MRPVRDASHDYLPNLEYNFLVSCKIQSTLTLPGRAARVDQPRAPFSFSPLLVSFALTPPFCRPLLLLPGIYTPPAPGICQPATWQPTANQTGMKRQREDPQQTEMKRERILRAADRSRKKGRNLPPRNQVTSHLRRVTSHLFRGPRLMRFP